MKGKEKKDKKTTEDLDKTVSRRTFLASGKTVLLGASYVVISLFVDRTTAQAACTGCTSGSTTVTAPPCGSCTACTGCTGCTKWCTGGCCISCTKCTSQ